MSRTFLSFTLLALAVPALLAEETAELIDAEGKSIGRVTLNSTEHDGQPAVQIRVQVDGLASAEGGGLHALHLHEVGKCEPPEFKAAGSHYNPTGAEHGFLAGKGPHAGDLPNIWVRPDGKADYQWTTSLVTLEDGSRTLKDRDGTALIIHAKADDYISQPSGAGGPMIACAVLAAGAQ